MKTQMQQTELSRLCATVRARVLSGAPEACLDTICRAMEHHPHAPQPHNLMGIVLEKLGDHPAAMRHFRAAWALDPGYAPANHNLQTYGTFSSPGSCAFDEDDLVQPKGRIWIEYDSHGIGHAVRR